MIKAEEVTIDGERFNIMPFPWDETLELDTTTMSILAPALDMLGNFKGLDEEFDLSGLGGVLQKVLVALKKENLFSYILSMTKNTHWFDKEAPTQLSSKKVLDKAFRGKTMMAIKLLIEIMKVNKFAFIEGVAGSGLNLTSIFKAVTGGTPSKEESSETLEP